MVQDDGADALTYLKADINRAIRILHGELDLPPLERSRSITTTTSDTYPLPENFIRFKQLYVTISSIRYNAEPIFDEKTWQTIKANTLSSTSNILRAVFVRPGSNNLEIFPVPSSAGNTMTLLYEASEKDLSASDYTTGTITTLANGGTTVTFSGATLTSSMVGRWLKTDDGKWYLIDSVNTGAGTAVIHQPYQGTAISAGSSTFTIGEMSRLPIGMQHMPVHYAAYRYFAERRRDEKQAKIYKDLWDEDKKQAQGVYSRKFTSAIIKSPRSLLRRFMRRNPNDWPSDLSS